MRHVAGQEMKINRNNRPSISYQVDRVRNVSSPHFTQYRTIRVSIRAACPLPRAVQVMVQVPDRNTEIA